MNKNPLRLAILGFGWVARDYMRPAIDACADTELVAVSSLDLEDCASVIDRVDAYTNWREMIERDDIDAVYIATPNYLHREQTLACLHAGKHVLCEKPMALTTEDAQAMVGTAEDMGLVYATAFDQRFHPAHRAMREWVSAGRIGILTQARIDYACWLPHDWAADNWRIEQSKAGGGAIIDLAPHGLDLLETLTGDRIAELTLFPQTVVQQYSVDDGGTLMARFESGMLATLHVGYNRPEALPRRRLELIGTEGMLQAYNTMGQVAGGTVTYHDTQGEVHDVAFESDTEPFLMQVQNFAASILTDAPPIRRATDDVRLVALLQNALLRSSDSTSLNTQSVWH